MSINIKARTSRVHSKFRVLRRIVFAKSFLYMQKDIAVGAFSNKDMVAYTMHMAQIIDSTIGYDTLDEVQEALEKEVKDMEKKAAKKAPAKKSSK